MQNCFLLWVPPPLPFFTYRVVSVSDYPQSPYIAKGGLELLILLCRVLRLQVCATTLSLLEIEPRASCMQVSMYSLLTKRYP